MSAVGQGLGLVLAGFGLLAIIGVAFVYFRGSADKATLESQGRLLASRKDEIDDLTRRMAAVEAENQHLRVAVAQVQGIDHLQATADAIKADVAAIRAKVSA